MLHDVTLTDRGMSALEHTARRNAANMPAAATSWRQIPTALLQAELKRRFEDNDDSTRPACGSGKRGAYNTAAHVGALVLILSLSTIACGLPLISRRASKHAGPNRFIFFSQHFGTGVLIATAFVHLLPTAFLSLTDPCLPGIWHRYKPTAGLIAMVAAMSVVAIEMFLRTRGAQGHNHAHGEGWDSLATEDTPSPRTANGHVGTAKGTYRKGRPGAIGRPKDIMLGDIESSGLVKNASPFTDAEAHFDEDTNQKFDHNDQSPNDDDESDLDLDELDGATEAASHSNHEEIHSPAEGLSISDDRQKKLLQCLLLEAGILFHSVFIGMAISVATGPAFWIFLLAISFHQTFEGIALGTRIASISFPKSSPRPWLMVLAYGMTTPLGQAIGIAVNGLYDPRSETGLLMVGIMNAVSSGLLLFAGLVQLLSEDFLTDRSYETLVGTKRWQAFGCVVGGAFLMALVGAWA